MQRNYFNDMWNELNRFFFTVNVKVKLKVRFLYFLLKKKKIQRL